MKVIALFFALLCMVVACGYDDGDTVIRKKPKPQPQLTEEVQGLLATHCGGCHGPGKAQKALDSKARLDAAKGKIGSDAMPPGGGLSDEVKQTLLGG